jgi:hypothetical protein
MNESQRLPFSKFDPGEFGAEVTLPPPLNKCNSGAKPCSEYSQWLSPCFARSAQANNALTMDLSPLTIPSSERILFKKPLLKSPLLTHYYIYLGGESKTRQKPRKYKLESCSRTTSSVRACHVCNTPLIGCCETFKCCRPIALASKGN